MKLFYSPGACSLGIHVLLEEIGRPFELSPVAMREGAQYQPPFTSLNPKSRVPTLQRDDGSVLTEYVAIALYLARTNPEAGLLPRDAEAEARVFETLAYVVGTVHGQGFRLIFRPQSLTGSEENMEPARAKGREIVQHGAAILSDALPALEQAAGAFSIADSALFYVERWMDKQELDMPATLRAHYERLGARPAVQRALAAEGLS